MSGDPHLCLSCSCLIVDRPEVRVKMKTGVRYRHEKYEDCAEALRNPPREHPFPRSRGRQWQRRAEDVTRLITRANDRKVLTPEEFDAL